MALNRANRQAAVFQATQRATSRAAAVGPRPTSATPPAARRGSLAAGTNTVRSARVPSGGTFAPRGAAAATFTSGGQSFNAGARGGRAQGLAGRTGLTSQATRDG